jgi:membrane protease YdiL (CAAX protease family)
MLNRIGFRRFHFTLRSKGMRCVTSGSGAGTPKRTLLRRIGKLVALIITFWGATFAASLLGHWLNLSVLAGAVLGQVVLLAVCLAFALLDGDGVRSLGLTGAWRGYDPALIGGFLLVYLFGQTASGVALQQTGWMEVKDKPILELLRDISAYGGVKGTLVSLGLALQAGVGEELLFRGYLISRLERLGLGAAGTVLLSALCFGLIHWPGYGLAPALLKAFWWGLPTGLFFWYRRNLAPLIVAHTTLDFAMFNLGAFLIRLNPNLM